MPIDQQELGKKMGAFSAQIEAVDARITAHIHEEETVQKEIFDQLKQINDTLSQATGARKIVVWIIATLFAGAALAKGWLWKP